MRKVYEDRQMIARTINDYKGNSSDEDLKYEYDRLNILKDDLETMLAAAEELWENGDVMNGKRVQVRYPKLNAAKQKGLDAANDINKKGLFTFFTKREGDDFEIVVDYLKNRWSRDLMNEYGDWFAEEFQEMDAEYENATESLEGVIGDIRGLSKATQLYPDVIKNRF